MSFLRRQKSQRSSVSRSSFSKRLRFESLEQKNLLAGDVMISVTGGNLLIEGTTEDNGIIMSSTGTPGEYEFSSLVGTTFDHPVIGGVTGDVLVDFGAGGSNEIQIGLPGVVPSPLELPGDVTIEGGTGNEDISIHNAIINGNVALIDGVGGPGANVFAADTTITGNYRSETTADFSDIALSRSTVDGDVTLISEGVELMFSVVELNSSFVGGDVRFVSNAAHANTLIRGTEVGDDVILDTSDGDDSVIIGLGLSSTIGSTIGDDLRILSGGGIDDVAITGLIVTDDLVFRGGDGDDVFFMDASFVGDDLYLTGGAGADVLAIEGVDVTDKVRVSTGDGDDEVIMEEVNVGRSALVSLGSGENIFDAQIVDAGRSLTVLGRGTNDILLIDVATTHFVTIITSSGADIVNLQHVTTESALISTKAGEDTVSIGSNEDDMDSAFEYLYVSLGSGDDSLSLDGVTVERFAFLHGGSGNDTLVGSEDLEDTDFVIDFSF